MTRGSGSVLELFLWRAATPLITSGAYIKDVSQGTLSIFSSARKMAQKIEILEHEKTSLTVEVALLKSRIAELQRQKEEEGRLSEQLAQHQIVDAKIIGYNTGATKEWIMINRGLRDGIKTGMAVVTSEGVFVGAVTQQSEHVSRVELVTNTDSVIRGQTQSLTRGIVRGVSNLGAHFIKVHRSQPLADGDTVLTVRNTLIPEGLLIGTIYNVHISDDSLFQEAILTPAFEVGLRDDVRIILIEEGL